MYKEYNVVIQVTARFTVRVNARSEDEAVGMAEAQIGAAPFVGITTIGVPLMGEIESVEHIPQHPEGGGSRADKPMGLKKR